MLEAFSSSHEVKSVSFQFSTMNLLTKRMAIFSETHLSLAPSFHRHHSGRERTETRCKLARQEKDARGVETREERREEEGGK